MKSCAPTPRIKANIILVAVMEDESAVSDGLRIEICLTVGDLNLKGHSRP